MLLGKLYSENVEEYWNVTTHSVGALLAFFGSIYLISLTYIGAEDFKFASVLIFSISMMMVYIASSLYHYHWDKPFRNVYRTLDHITIYYLIAGTYTPFLLISYPEKEGWRLLLIIWGLSFMGTIFKFCFTDRFYKLSLSFYIFLGCTVFLDLSTFIESTPADTMRLIIAGGALYLIGVLFYVWKARFSHTIWHLFVMVANACHYLAVVSIL